MLSVAAAAYAALLTYLLVVPSPLWMFGSTGENVEESVDRTFSDLAQHSLAYGLFAWLLLAAFGGNSRRGLVMFFGLALLHAVGTELIQHFVPLRSLDWRDVTANVAGVVIGTGCVALLQRVSR